MENVMKLNEQESKKLQECLKSLNELFPGFKNLDIGDIQQDTASLEFFRPAAIDDQDIKF